MSYNKADLEDWANHRFSVTLTDGENKLDDRIKGFAEHRQGLASFKEKNPGVIEFAGPSVHPETLQPNGSVFVLKRGDIFPSVDAVNKWFDNDIFHKTNVWDKRQITLFVAATKPIL